MTTRLISIVLCSALVAAAASPAFAQGRGNGNGNGNGKGNSGEHGPPVGVIRDNNGVSGHPNPSTGAPPPGLAKRPGGLPPGQAKKLWAKGQVLPAQYRVPANYVTNTQTYHLQPAPAGYKWVLVDNEVYLVRNNTGLISSVVSLLTR